MKIFLRILSVISIICSCYYITTLILGYLINLGTIQTNEILAKTLSFSNISLIVTLVLISFIVSFYILSKHSFNKNQIVQYVTENEDKPEATEKEESKPNVTQETKKEEVPVPVVVAPVAPVPPVENRTESKPQTVGVPQKSYFDGTLLQLIGINLLNTLLFIITIGIIFPWNLTREKKWHCSHTYINGQRLKFIGSGGSLIGNWIKWILLSFVTIGIYSLWIPIKLKQWETVNTIFDESSN
jgi:magnesium-transporting ATPase (P-type)